MARNTDTLYQQVNTSNKHSESETSFHMSFSRQGPPPAVPRFALVASVGSVLVALTTNQQSAITSFFITTK